MKVQIYSQWMEDVYIPVRVKQFTKAAKLVGSSSFVAYAADHDMSSVVCKNEREAVVEWLDGRIDERCILHKGIVGCAMMPYHEMGERSCALFFLFLDEEGCIWVWRIHRGRTGCTLVFSESATAGNPRCSMQ